MLAPLGLKVGDMVVSGPEADIKTGNALPLGSIPLGTILHNIELMPGGGGKLVRAAGGAAQLMAKEGDYAQVRMPSGEVRMIMVKCRATIGQLGNVDHENQVIGKAGRTRWLGRRPQVRGIAMNPVDHPHGGVGRADNPGIVSRPPRQAQTPYEPSGGFMRSGRRAAAVRSRASRRTRPPWRESGPRAAWSGTGPHASARCTAGGMPR